MSGFSAEWLTQRAPFDTAARAQALGRRFVDAIPPDGLVVDLGAGTGNNVHALRGPNDRRRWRLVDHDPKLLERMRARFAGDPAVEIVAGDLMQPLAPLLAGAHAVTCSALLDLVSARWIDALAAALAANRQSALLVLIYDGRTRWTPADPDDARIADAFHRDMVRDKGFGPALGPDAVTYARRALARHGAHVDSAASDWRIGAGERAMLATMVDGHARVAADGAMLRAEHVTLWRARRLAQIDQGQLSLTIGHQDLLASWA